MNGPWTRFPTKTAGTQKPRIGILRGMGALLGASAAAFTLTIWLLVRMDAASGAIAPVPAANGAPGETQAAAPERVVRAQLDAFRRGQVREAYDLFSAHYREQVSFEAFHELVASHWRVLRTRTVQFESREATGARAVFDTHIVATDGERYLARYTLIESEGRWWIDEVHWGAEPDAPRHFAERDERVLTS